MKNYQSLFHHCLFFTANSLARIITRMANEEFRKTGLSPSHAFLLMLVQDSPGIGQKALCEALNLAPSTVTRFVDFLEGKGYIERKTRGKNTAIFPTSEGKHLMAQVDAAWKNLYGKYSDILGAKEGDALAALIDAACDKLEKSL